MPRRPSYVPQQFEQKAPVVDPNEMLRTLLLWRQFGQGIASDNAAMRLEMKKLELDGATTAMNLRKGMLELGLEERKLQLDERRLDRDLESSMKLLQMQEELNRVKGDLVSSRLNVEMERQKEAIIDEYMMDQFILDLTSYQKDAPSVPSAFVGLMRKAGAASAKRPSIGKQVWDSIKPQLEKAKAAPLLIGGKTIPKNMDAPPSPVLPGLLPDPEKVLTLGDVYQRMLVDTDGTTKALKELGADEQLIGELAIGSQYFNSWAATTSSEQGRLDSSEQFFLFGAPDERVKITDPAAPYQLGNPWAPSQRSNPPPFEASAE